MCTVVKLNILLHESIGLGTLCALKIYKIFTYALKKAQICSIILNYLFIK